jgi:filamentous hemagglutinin family protein
MDTKGLFKKIVNLVTLSSFLLWNFAVAVPEGGQVAAGSASISQAGSQTTINQTSQNAVINWHGFDTAAHESVQFNQPNANSIALNKINSGTPTNFNGSLAANGQVWILNPSGVLFGSSSKIDVAGLLVTTHNITDSNFMSGNYVFTFDPNLSNSKIINNGLISVSDSGIVALVAPGVENNGIIQANLGKVYLSSGAAFVLDMYGDSLINFGSSPAVQNGYVSNSGNITANGGKVYMTANSAAGVLDNVISMSGTIEATTASTGQNGSIILNGGHAGTVKVSGKLDASNHVNSSGGGTIETSGYNLDLNTATIVLGKGGTWTLDPPDIYTSTWNNVNVVEGNLISYQLDQGTNVTLSTGVSGSGNGDIFVDSPITWNTSAVLMLGAYRDINISQPITASNNGGFIARADLSANGTGTVNFSGSGSITVNGATGYAKLFYNPSSYSTPTDYSAVLLGSAPIKAGYMMINSVADLQSAAAGFTNIAADSYSLNTDIDGSVFTSTIFPGSFNGNFDGHDYATGLNHIIYNLNMTFGVIFQAALGKDNFGYVEDLGLTTCLLADCSTGSGSNSLTGTNGVSGFFDQNFGTVSHVFFDGVIVADVNIGAIVGRLASTGVVQYSYSLGTYTALSNFSAYSGGLVGSVFGGTIIDSYNGASLTGNLFNGGISGTTSGGGSTFTNVYSTGTITAGGGGQSASIVYNNIGTPLLGSGIYWDTTTSGPVVGAYGFGAGGPADTPLTDAQMKVAGNFPTFDFVNVWFITGVGPYPYPQLIQNSQVIDRTQVAGFVDPLRVGNKIKFYANGVSLGNPNVDANGVVVMNFDPNPVFSASSAPIIFVFDQTNPFGDLIAKIQGPVGNLNLVNNTITVRSDVPNVAVKNSEVAAQPNTDLYTGSGNDIIANPGVDFVTTAGVVYSPLFTTTNTIYEFDGNLNGANNITFNGPVTVTLIGNPAFINNTGNTIFNSTLDGPETLFMTSTGTITFNDVVGVGTPLTNLVVNGSQTYINTFEMSASSEIVFDGPVLINSGGLMTFNGGITFAAPVESTGTPAQIVINGSLDLAWTTIGASSDVSSLYVSGQSELYGDITTSGNSTFVGSVDLRSDSTVTSTGGSITFGDVVSGSGCGFFWGLTVTTTPGSGTTTFKGDVGLPVFALDGMVSFLTVNGTSVINGATQIITNNNQTYSDTVTLMNSVTMKTAVDGDIQLNGGGAVDPGITLTLYSADTAKGSTGLGITGTVNVDNLIVGGPGGANLSLNYPVTESFVGGPSGGAGQAIQNTVISPDFRASGAIYCVNNFCALIPVPPDNNPGNIPPTQIFNVPLIGSCDAAGCGNLEVVVDNLEEAGVVSCGGSGSGEYGCAYGFVEAKDTNGNSRILMPGDVVYAGDRISKNSESCMCIKSIYSKKKTCMGPGKTKAVYEK